MLRQRSKWKSRKNISTDAEHWGWQTEPNEHGRLSSPSSQTSIGPKRWWAWSSGGTYCQWQGGSNGGQNDLGIDAGFHLSFQAFMPVLGMSLGFRKIRWGGLKTHPHYRNSSSEGQNWANEYHLYHDVLYATGETEQGRNGVYLIIYGVPRDEPVVG